MDWLTTDDKTEVQKRHTIAPNTLDNTHNIEILHNKKHERPKDSDIGFAEGQTHQATW